MILFWLNLSLGLLIKNMTSLACYLNHTVQMVLVDSCDRNYIYLQKRPPCKWSWLILVRGIGYIGRKKTVKFTRTIYSVNGPG